jgi:hypothetical protein
MVSSLVQLLDTGELIAYVSVLCVGEMMATALLARQAMLF